jgi:hypothetical protein
MGQARHRKAEIAELKSNAGLVVDLDKIAYQNVPDINAFVKSISGCDDRVLQLMKDLTGNDPEIVNVVNNGGIPLQCHDNAADLALKLGGTTQTGWLMMITTDKENFAYGDIPNHDATIAVHQRRYGIQEFNQHMIVRATDGQLYDSTPAFTPGMGKTFRIFWPDDKLLTVDAFDYEVCRYTHNIIWGQNIMYLPWAGRGYLRHTAAQDIQHIVIGELCGIRPGLIPGRYRKVQDHNERYGVAKLQASYM